MSEPVPAVIVSPAQYRPLRPLVARGRVAGGDVVAVAGWTRDVVTHDVTRGLVRQAVYVPAGVRALWRWWRETYGGARYDRALRDADARGDSVAMLDILARAEAEKQRRHQRVVNFARLVVDLVKATPAILALIIFGFLSLGILLAVTARDISMVMAPFRAVAWAVATVVWLVTVTGATLAWAIPCLIVLALWAAGRRAGDVPEFLAPASGAAPTTREVIPDEGAILAALKDLGIPKYKEKLKEGWQPRWPLPTVLDGKGYRTQLELPRGVNVEMINKKRDLLAHNLVRLPVEVWPTEPQNQPGVLDLWVAHQGLLSGPVAPYPHLKDGTCDYFKGVPVGTDQRGQVLIGRLMACNYAIGGTMGSGKSSLVLNLVTGAALDPLVDIDVYVMAYNVDYDPFKGRLSTLVKGDEDEHITAAMEGLRELREEVTKRGKLLDTLGGEETKVTRALAKQDRRLRPRLVVFDECQELFRHEKYGEQAKQLAIKVMTKARKCGITLIWVTPEPSADSLPRELAKIVSHGVCFAIGDYQGNDAILGTGAYKRGISAVDLDPQENIGTAMAFGFAGRPGLLRAFYIRKDATADELTPIARRSVDPWCGATSRSDEARDLVADVADAVGAQDVTRARDVVAGLRQLAPGHEPYAALSGAKLVQSLRQEGVRTTLKDGYEVVHRDRVYQVIAAREDAASEPGH